MNTIKTKLPGVKEIKWVDCQKLQRRVDLQAICMAPVPVLTEQHSIEFFGEVECSSKYEKKSGMSQVTANLQFKTSEELPTHVRLGFVVTDVVGCKWLIGSKEPPYPQITMTRNSGTAQGEPAALTYEITHIAIKTLMLCE